MAKKRWLALGNGGRSWKHVNIGVLTFSNTKFATVNALLLAQRWPYNYAPTVDFEYWTSNDPISTCLPTVIFLKLIVMILSVWISYYLLSKNNFVRVFYKNNSSKYLLIFRGFVYWKLRKSIPFG